MFDWKKIAMASGVLGGLALAGLGVAHAEGSAGYGGCTRDASGQITCAQTTEYTSEDGTVHVQQKRECTSVSDNYTYRLGEWRKQSPAAGNMNCSNVAPSAGGAR
ncbi:hypothetical protein [Streptomyces sp. NPDC018031]|uniref:hypothetical protein n=1 Tax=Streptomyces sp. NPDC018031 TaxID=3365033 RepID=UPI00378EC71C